MSNEPVHGAPPVVLTFAASDPSGATGMQADLLTLASMGCHPLSVVTAITVQDTTGVASVWFPAMVSPSARTVSPARGIDTAHGSGRVYVSSR